MGGLGRADGGQLRLGHPPLLDEPLPHIRQNGHLFGGDSNLQVIDEGSPVLLA